MEETTSLPAPTQAEAGASIERARMKAAVHLELLSERLATKALDPTATAKTMLDTAEFNYKLSGLAAKQTAGAQGPAFRVSFNFNAAKPSRGATIDVTPVVEDDLPELPAHLTALEMTNDLICDAELLG